ncbi:hypothetical protein PPERSA_11697 [Pseudocohnilembus persalinus]|uniref:Uncharacterized protein n=1 Tax=Pseudocohnilembus persalinus TaxID=266149 RepID=A0A0V0R137_PSEPJ|nr:hypothetical protein PPERSA_11697 [Pseudocohnilembus persalinus]|eukprot:KRX08220.1 hypothetical protein PPERSA_11697 [Pseudocohnilembus persalinus]
MYGKPRQDPQQLKKSYECQNCEKLLDHDSIYYISIKMIIQAWNQDRDMNLNKDQTSQISNFQQNSFSARQIKNEQQTVFQQKLQINPEVNIPKPLKKYINENQIEYDQLMILFNNPMFLSEQIQVCEQCYLTFLDSAHCRENAQKLAQWYSKKFDMDGNLMKHYFKDKFNDK